MVDETPQAPGDRQKAASEAGDSLGQNPDSKAKSGKKKSPAEKRAEATAEREQWSQERIDEAILANGGTPKAQKEESRGPGQPTKYSGIDLERVEMYAGGGLTKKEIAEAMGIGLSTAMEYQNRYPEFLEAIDRGRSRRITAVENALHKVSLGHYVPEEKVHYDMQVGKWVREPTLKYYPPDTKAALAILLHAETKSWKPRSEMEHSFPEPTVIKGPDGKVIETLNAEPPPKQ